jgi:hypothetical protein
MSVATAEPEARKKRSAASENDKFVLVPLTLQLIKEQCFDGNPQSRRIPAVWKMWLLQLCELEDIPRPEKNDADWPRNMSMTPTQFFSKLDGGPQVFRFTRKCGIKFRPKYEDAFDDDAGSPFDAEGKLDVANFRPTIMSINQHLPYWINSKNEICQPTFGDGTFYVLTRESDGSVVFSLEHAETGHLGAEPKRAHKSSK